MYKLYEIDKYSSKLGLIETQKAIAFVRQNFQINLSKCLKVIRVSAPMIVKAKSGINDDLNGVERPVRFDIKEMDGMEAEIVHSLAKWKRLALKYYNFPVGEGLFTNMNAIRRDDDVDNLHSIYVDQWDWEQVIDKSDRTKEYLFNTVRMIANAMADTSDAIRANYPDLETTIERNVYFISSQDLEDMFPTLTPSQREIKICEIHKTVFIYQIGALLKSGVPQGGRAPDYDDWNLNGDLFVWSPILKTGVELSSMGIRVDAESLESQLKARNALDRLNFDYHRKVMTEQVPFTIGGGIGQSRLCLILLDKAHIGEVQASVWPPMMLDECKKNGIEII